MCTLAGAICLLAGYAGVADSQYLAEQTRYIVSGGIGGIFLLGVGATLWISADLRDEWRKLDRIERALGDGVLKWSDESVNGASHGTPPASVDITTEQAGLAHAANSRHHA
ncbi:hypothetical protein [Sporichthya brevicatena]|uniref:hypothetical protein n=1 Tax=Sporichthya brevicatena TaxID=171442 RepID=UPI0031D17E72